MKLRTKIFCLAVSLFLVFAGFGCAGGNEPAQQRSVEVTATVDSVEIKEYDVEGKNYTSYFTIKNDGTPIEVLSEYVDASAVKAEVGEYEVTCKYEDKSATLTVKVLAAEYTLKATETLLTFTEKEIVGVDFKAYFTATRDGVTFAVTDEMITSDVENQPGEYSVTAKLGGKTATVKVVVKQPEYALTALIEEITIADKECDGYDFKPLFSVTKDGEPLVVTDEMITSDVENRPGEYSVTLTVGGVSASIKVYVVHETEIEAYVSYREYSVTETELGFLDVTMLFSLFVDGKAVKVTPEMIDASELSGAVVGNAYTVRFSYEYDGKKVERSTVINVVAEKEIAVTAKNIETYPNSGILDLTSLFTITKGDENIPVTADMISGSVDYSQVGENEITLTYGGKKYRATVTVKLGVVISSASGEVRIKKGTNKQKYDFIGDFVVKINGLEFSLISSDYLRGVEEVDFDKVGEYEVSLDIPYCTKTPNPWTQTVEFDIATYVLKYVVIEKEWSVSLKEELVRLPQGTTSYNVFSNVDVKINGRNQSLTDNPDWEDSITCYAQVVSAPVDFDYAGEQRVIIDVFAAGSDAEPVRVEYTIIIESEVVITAYDKSIFVGADLNLSDLFEIRDGNSFVTPSYEMITGKADVFTKGRYVLTLTYKQVSAVANVTVIDGEMVGVYVTAITEVNKTDDEDDGYDDDSSWGSYSAAAATSAQSRATLGNLVINDDGSLIVNGESGSMLGAIDENSVNVLVRIINYVLYYDDGIVVLDVDNSIKTGFSNTRRPLVYFNENKWLITASFTLNYSDNHVILMTYSSYSLEMFRITNKESGEEKWFALRIILSEKTSIDTVYKVDWGFADCNIGEMSIGQAGSIEFKGDKYKFYFLSKTTAKVDSTEEPHHYANKTFTGTVDGKNAVLRADQYEGFTFIVDGKTVISASLYEINNMPYGGPDYDEKTVFLYGMGDRDNGVFSYKFSVDPDNDTFELIERDYYFGKYVTDGAYVYLDGYGAGYVNFNTASYVKTRFEYVVSAGELTLRFVDVPSSFAYGEQASFYFDGFGNVLTPKNVTGADFTGKTFENVQITDGAIVRIGKKTMGAETSKTAKAKLLESIEIITKDGVLSEDEKSQCVDLSKISFTTPGFYQYTVTVTLRGQEVTSYYALQIIGVRYENNEFVGSIGKGFVSGHYISLDKYGLITADCNGTRFEGLAQIEGNALFAIMRSADGRRFTLNAEIKTAGIVYAEAMGSVTFSDYFSPGEVAVTGRGDTVIRKVTYGEKTTYFVSGSVATIGDEVEVRLIKGDNIELAGTVFAVVYSDGMEKIFRIEAWGNTDKGITPADAYRGTYTEGETELILDGFGSATFGGQGASYQLNGEYATVKMLSDGSLKVFRLNKNDFTAVTQQVALDETLVKGKSYSSVYMFVTDDGVYSATTTFTFGEGGKVIIASSSSEYEQDSYGGKYTPAFSGEGTYSVKNDVVTVKIGNVTFTFTVTNVLYPNSMVCTQTTLSEGDVGYFGNGTVFNA